jgi:ABC-2 type transport system ATP-binding protein
VIEVRGLTRRYGSTVAVDRLSFDVPPGAVTGFLGLNGSGKSTTMRMILGLDAPDGGHARIGGQAYRQLRWPLREAGALLESRAFHPGRSARAHLAALLLDEPVNGLDPEGIRWIRGLLRSLAAEGRAVLVSSHLISEMALMADRLVVIGQGRLLADTTAAELSGRAPSLEEAFLQLAGDSAQYQARNMS